MDAAPLIAQLRSFQGVLPALLGSLTSEHARWRPEEGAWSVLEIITHLAVEEVEDFRARMRLCLEDPSLPWPPIDPGGDVQKRNFNGGDLGETIERFERERAASITWLESLESPKWENTYEHARLGPLSAADLLVSWTAHDTLHLRQLAHRRFQWTAHCAGEHSPAYAGEW